MDITLLRDLASKRLRRRSYSDGVLTLEYGNAVLLQALTSTTLEATIYQPLLCVVFNGAKEVSAGENTVKCSAGEMIVVSHHLPVMSRVVAASNDDPYMALILPLDPECLRRYFELAQPIETANGAALVTQPTEPKMLNCLHRLLSLGDDPNESSVIAPLIQDEIHARLLLSPAGGYLARLMWHDDKAAQISKAISMIRNNIAESAGISALAAAAGMSKSAFHVHFKAVTGMSPLSYAKNLRLIYARAEIRESRKPIAVIAHGFGYESPAQFSRDYAGKFGLSPREDRNATRLTV